MGKWVFLIPALPAAGAAALLLAGKRLRSSAAGWIATALVGGSFALSIAAALEVVKAHGEERVMVVSLGEWIAVGRLRAAFEFLVDPLSIIMILVVTGVGMLIHIYSIGYMHDDPRYSRFFAYLNLFAASMLVLVLANNMILMFLGWEGVGLCSYLLISFWFEKDTAAAAGKKAFVTNRVGDFGFILGTLLLFTQAGTLTILGGPGGGLVTAAPAMLSSGAITVATLLLFLGATGKSAQLPLLVWLPDAMEGPTPVSALIHAATMVTAGVYMIARLSPVFSAAPTTMWVIAAVGAVTAIVAASIALVQTDLKKVLAYSTISQLGFMFTAVGVGAFAMGIFHLVTHAFFKALLFLGAGSVMHAMNNTVDMRNFGALRKKMAITWGTWMIGWLAIAGIPPLAGFFSKDAILAAVFEHGRGGKLIWVLLTATAFLTSVYMSRATYLTFLGKARWSESEYHPHESPKTMTIPLLVLAGATVLAGLLGVPKLLPILAHWLEPSVGEIHEPFGAAQLGLLLAATLIAVAGILVARSIWLLRSASQRGELVEKLPLGSALLRFFGRGWGIDHLYRRVFVDGGAWLAKVLKWVDVKVIDGAVNGVARLVRGGGREVSRTQTGYVRNYALGIALGVVLLFGGFIIVQLVVGS